LQTVELTSLVNRPGLQSTHTLLPGRVLYLPTGQGEHFCMPVAVWKNPMGHASHTTDLFGKAMLVNLPEAQLEHSMVPSSSAVCPGEHPTQKRLPNFRCSWPLGQGSHTVVLVLLENVPCGHLKHSSVPILLACRPGMQFLHKVVPQSGWALPRGHGVHSAMLGWSAKEPGAHSE
jgi:hypothetical protein